MLKIPLNCTACSACVNICPQKCINMYKQSDGFWYPNIKLTACINCNLCEKVCPLYQNVTVNTPTSAIAMKSLNEKERACSTSGGAFSLIARYVLDNGGIVYGAAYASDFSTHHIAIEKKEDLVLLQGSKYVQSDLGICFSDIKTQLHHGRKVLFSGTPCQCMGLKSFLQKDYNNLLLVDIICHGIPSPKVWQHYINYRSQKENNGKRPININMRSKISGWSRYNYSTEFTYTKRKIKRVISGQDLFMKAFVGNICLRKSCSDCKAKGVNRCTDFTLGDYWGIWEQYPEFDDNKGVSAVFIHTQKAKKVLNKLKNEIQFIEVNLADAYQMNDSLLHSIIPHEMRKDFLLNINENNFENLVEKYFPTTDNKKTGCIRRIVTKLFRTK